MIKRVLNRTERITGFSQYLFFALAIFTCTFFVYKDFGLRMIFGFFAMGVLLAIHVLHLWQRGEKMRFSPVEKAFLFFIVVSLFCFCRPDARHDSSTVSYFIALLVCGACALISRPGKKDLKLGLGAFVGAATVFSIALLVFKLYPDLYWNHVYPFLSKITQDMAWYYVRRGYGIPIGGNYYFANCILALGLSAVMGYLLSCKGRSVAGIVAAGLGFLIFTGSALTGVRGDFIAVIVTFVFVYIISALPWAPGTVLKKLTSIVAVCLILALILVMLNAGGLIPRYASTIEKVLDYFVEVGNGTGSVNPGTSTLPDADSGNSEAPAPPTKPGESSASKLTSGRSDLWKLSLELFTEYPVFGIGWGNFSKYIPDAWREVHGEQVTNVHNFILQFLCETGIVGTIFLLLPIGYIYLHTLAQTLRLKKQHSPDKKWLIRANGASLAIQTFFCVGGMLSSTIFQFVFWCCYAGAVILSATALRLEGYAFNDFFTSWVRNMTGKGGSVLKAVVKK